MTLLHDPLMSPDPTEITCIHTLVLTIMFRLSMTVCFLFPSSSTNSLDLVTLVSDLRSYLLAVCPCCSKCPIHDGIDSSTPFSAICPGLSINWQQRSCRHVQWWCGFKCWVLVAHSQQWMTKITTHKRWPSDVSACTYMFSLKMRSSWHGDDEDFYLWLNVWNMNPAALNWK